MKVLVTGASGKLGGSIARALSGSCDLVLLSRRSDYEVPGATIYTADIEDVSVLQAIFQDEQPDVVIHLASILGAACDADPAKALSVNVQATKNLALLAHEYNVKQFIFASTAAVYKQDLLEPTPEDANIAPSSLYGETKLQAETAISEVAKGSTTSFVSFRIFNIYGPEFALSLVNRLIASSAGTDTVQLQGFERFCRDYIYVDDVIRVMTNFETMPTSGHHSVFNIASGYSTSNAELIAKLEEAGINPAYEVVGNDTSYSWADIEHARKELRFAPRSTLKLDW